MDEQMWLAAIDPFPMFGYEGGGRDRDPIWLQQFPGDRKLRQFAIACCRLIDGFPWRGEPIPLRAWAFDPATDAIAVAALEVAERYADGLASPEELAAANLSMNDASVDNPGDERYSAVFGTTYPTIRACDAVMCSFGAVHADLPRDDDAGFGEHAWSVGVADQVGREIHARLLRCIFGNPFRPVAVEPSWFTSTVAPLARGVYDDRAFDRLPILADALMDAGCDNADVLNHCRDAGPHARGCWVVDLLLGKA